MYSYIYSQGADRKQSENHLTKIIRTPDLVRLATPVSRYMGKTTGRSNALNFYQNDRSALSDNTENMGIPSCTLFIEFQKFNLIFVSNLAKHGLLAKKFQTNEL